MEEQLKKKPCYIINPASPGMNVWDIVTALALIFTALVTPFEVGFLPSAESPLEALFLINRLLDGSVTQMAESIFVVDMVISSLLMYRVPQSRKVEKSLDATNLKGQATADELSGRAGGTGYNGGKKPTAALTWEFRYRHVLYNYLTGWFFIDMLAVGPSAFDVYDLATTPSAVVNATASPLELGLGDVIGSSNGTALLDEAGGGGNLKVVKVLRVIRTLRLFKLLRLMRGSKIIKRWATRVSMPYATIAIAKLLLMVLYVTHFSACMLGVMATFSEPNAKLDSWQGYYGYCGGGSIPTGARGKSGDVLSYDLVDNSGTFTCVGPFEMWLASLGWAIAIIVSGGGSPQAGPYPGNESADPMNYLRGETVFLIFFLLAMAALWAYIDDLNRFCAFHSLPDAMRRTLREYAHEHYERKRVFADLSDALKATVAWQLNGDWLESIPVLQQLPQKFLVQVALNMIAEVYAPKEQPPAQRLYVITKGFCTYGGQTLKPGGHWGQNDMASNTQPLRATAITYLHVNYVATQTIFELADKYDHYGGPTTILWQIKRWVVWHKVREHGFAQLKLKRRRDAWREAHGEHEPLPADLQEKALCTVEKALTVENRVYKLANDVDQVQRDLREVKDTVAAIAAHLKVGASTTQS